MSESMALVGLDVHQAQTVVAVLDPSTCELRVGRLRGEPASSQTTFVDYLCAMQTLVGRRRTLIGALEEAVPGSSHAETVAKLRCCRGIDTLTAAGLCAGR